MSKAFTLNQKCHTGTRGEVRGLPKSLGFMIWGPGRFIQNVAPIQPVEAEINHWISEHFDLFMVLIGTKKVRRAVTVIMLYPLGIMKICTTFQGDSGNSF